MGEAQGWQFNPTFNRSVKVTAGDERLTSDAGVLLIREADQRLGLTEWLADQLMDPRDPRRIRYELSELLRERLYALHLGYENQDDDDRLAHDPAMHGVDVDSFVIEVHGQQEGAAYNGYYQQRA